MEQDNGAAKLRLGFHGVQLVEHELRDLSRSFTVALIPVVGVDFVSDDSKAELLNPHNGRGLIIGVRFFVNIVGRTEVEWLDAEFAGEKAFGELDLEIELIVRDFADVGMEESVIADLVAFALNPLHEADVFLSLGADHHECALDLFFLENVEDFRGPFGIRSVIKRERDLVGMIAVVLDRIGMWKRVHVLVDDEFFARVGLVVYPRLRCAYRSPVSR